jgi:hypothetical protein
MTEALSVRKSSNSIAKGFWRWWMLGWWWNEIGIIE